MIWSFNNCFFPFIVCLGFLSVFNKIIWCSPPKFCLSRLLVPMFVSLAIGRVQNCRRSVFVSKAEHWSIHTKIFSPPVTLHTAKEISAGIQLLLLSLAVPWIIYSPGKTMLWGCYKQLEEQGWEPWALVSWAASPNLVMPLGSCWLNSCSELAAQEPLWARSEWHRQHELLTRSVGEMKFKCRQELLP